MEFSTVEVTKDRKLPFKPITICPIGDIQYGAEACNLEGFREHLDWTLTQPNPYYIGMGDIVDFGCVEVDAEALTRSGWQRWDKLVIGQDIAAYDGSQIVWTPLEDIQVFHNAPITEMSSKSFRARVTPNHRWITKRHGLEETRDLEGHADNLVITATAIGGESPVTPPEAALLGWLITDGHTRWQDYFSIMQAKQEYVRELQELLKGAIRRELTPTPENESHLQLHIFELDTKVVRAILLRAGIESSDYREVIPLILSMSKDARAAMLDAMLKAEGTYQKGAGNREGGWRFSQSKKHPIVCDAFQLLCLLQGRRQSPTTYDMKFSNGRRGTVWCPTTKYGTWVMRQGDQTAITGNSPSNRGALKALIEQGQLYDTAQDIINNAAQQHLEGATKFLAPTKDQWLGMVSGHHFWTWEDGQTSDTKLAQELGSPFLGTCGIVRIRFEGTDLSLQIWVHHGRGSGVTQAAPINKLERLASHWENIDIFLMAHHHKQIMAKIVKLRAKYGRRTARLVEREVSLVGTGGFLRGYVEGSRSKVGPRATYVEEGMLNPLPLGAPVFSITPDKNGIKIRTII